MAKKPGFLSDSQQRGGEFITPGQKEVTLSLVPEALIVGHVKFPTAETAEHLPVQLYRREVRDGFAHVGAADDHRNPLRRRVSLRRPAGWRVQSIHQRVPGSGSSGRGAKRSGLRISSAILCRRARFLHRRHHSSPCRRNFHRQHGSRKSALLRRQGSGSVSIQPLPMGLAVSVYAQGHRGPGFELGYDPSLGAVIGSLPNGNYTIEASSQGPTPATGMVNITVANRPVNGPVLTVAPNTTIEVNIHQDMTGAEAAHRSPNGGSREPTCCLRHASISGGCQQSAWRWRFLPSSGQSSSPDGRSARPLLGSNPERRGLRCLYDLRQP